MGAKPILTAEKIKGARDYLKHYNGKPDEGGYGDVIPTFVGLGRAIGLTKAQIVDIRRKDDDAKVAKSAAQKLRVRLKAQFMEVTTEMVMEQERVLLNGGITGVFNPQIAKMLLGKYGYVEKKELTGADGEDLVPRDTKWTVEVVRPGEA